MKDSNKVLEDIIYNSPLALLTIKDKEIINLIREYLPYSIGFEIECDKGNNYNVATFEKIPDIMDVDVDSYEQRYRIPEGIRGLVCLYNISCQLKLQSKFNSGSGIHYHCDFTECYNAQRIIETYSQTFTDSETKIFYSHFGDWVLSELDKWEFKGAQTRGLVGFIKDSSFGTWIRQQPDFKTIEFRCGNMTFDYKVLATRIIHLNKISREIKNKLQGKTKTDNFIKNKVEKPLDVSAILEYIRTYNVSDTQKLFNDYTLKEKEVNEKLTALRNAQNNKPITSIDKMKEIIQARTKKL